MWDLHPCASDTPSGQSPKPGPGSDALTHTVTATLSTHTHAGLSLQNRLHGVKEAGHPHTQTGTVHCSGLLLCSTLRVLYCHLLPVAAAAATHSPQPPSINRGGTLGVLLTRNTQKRGGKPAGKIRKYLKLCPHRNPQLSPNSTQLHPLSNHHHHHHHQSGKAEQTGPAHTGFDSRPSKTS